MEKKQRVLIIHNYYQIPGGEDTVVANEKRLLEDNGHDVILYSKNNSELKSFSKIQRLLLPVITIFNFKTYKDVVSIIKEKQIDIVHVHNTLNMISPSVYYAAFHCKVPVVQTIHNFRLLCPGATFYRDGKICEDCVSNGLMCAVKNSCYRGSKLQTLACVISTKIHRMLGTYEKLNYICLTEFNKEKLLQLKQVRTERVFVKPNFVGTNDKIIPYEQRADQFVYAGRLDKLKGIDVLLKQWKQMGKDAPNLIICGTGPMENWCKSYIEENQLDSIEMKGFVKNSEVKKIIAISKALILPTQWYEGFPMTIVEAYSVGTPVIGSNIGNVGSLVEEGVTGWKFEIDASNMLAEVVQQSENICDSTLERYKLLYTAASNYKELLNIYNQVQI